MTEEEITRVLADMGQPAFRGKQVFTWLHRGVRSFDEMSNLSKPLRQQLAQAYTISVPTVARKQESRLDGTIKYLWELPDGNCIETVLMQYHHGNTVCISSQVGCRMGCAFCASTVAGKVRDLTAGEMCCGSGLRRRHQRQYHRPVHGRLWRCHFLGPAGCDCVFLGVKDRRKSC